MPKTLQHVVLPVLALLVLGSACASSNDQSVIALETQQAPTDAATPPPTSPPETPVESSSDTATQTPPGIPAPPEDWPQDEPWPPPTPTPTPLPADLVCEARPATSATVVVEPTDDPAVFDLRLELVNLGLPQGTFYELLPNGETAPVVWIGGPNHTDPVQSPNPRVQVLAADHTEATIRVLDTEPLAVGATVTGEYGVVAEQHGRCETIWGWGHGVAPVVDIQG